MDRAARIALLVYLALLAVPLRFFAIETGLDPSWAFALKWFHSKGLKYGEDVVFTWGPLGHLAIAMNINGGLASAVTAQLFGWGAYVTVVAYFTLVRRVALWRLAAFTAFTYAGVRMFHSFGYAGFDFFLSWLALLLIACSAVSRRWWIPWTGTIVIAAVLLLMKLSTGIAAASALVTYPAGLLLINRNRAARAGFSALAGLPLLFVAGFSLHNPSLPSMARYIHAGFEISSEHSTILSLPGPPITLHLALALLSCYAALAALLFFTRNAAFPIAVAMAGPLFLEFKHSFIREPGHVEMLFLFMPLVAAVLVLVVNASGSSRYAPAAIGVAFAAVLIYSQRGALTIGTGLQYAQPLAQLAHWDTLRANLKQRNEANLSTDRLPADLLARVRGRTVTIFPWESSYAAANRLEYRPFPVFQSYDAYTPYLDGWNAEFFDKAERAPDFVIFDWAAIDGRHALLDVPQTALALYRNYELEGTFGGHLLLRRLSQPRFPKLLRTVRRETMRIGEKLRLPERANAAVVNLKLKWNLEGALKKFFWRLPEIRWIAAFGDGSTLSARIPPAVIAAGVAVDLIPSDVRAMRGLYSGEPGRQVEYVVIAGVGAKHLVQDIDYELATLEGAAVRAVPTSNPNVVPGLRGGCKIDFVNTSPVAANGSAAAGVESGSVVFRGWALSATDIVLSVDGRMRRAESGIERPDVVAAYREDPQSRPGFELTVPAADLQGPVHKIEALARNTAGGYQICAEAVNLTLH
jgi:hypothetical protein